MGTKKERTINPESLKNLSRAGRTPTYGQNKATHEISVSSEGWELIKEMAKPYGGVSAMVEKIARGQIRLVIGG